MQPPRLTRNPVGTWSRKSAVAFALAAAIFAWSGGVPPHSHAASDASLKVVAVVNDEPITEYDVSQRVKLARLLNGVQGNEAALRKEALEALVEDVLKRTEAKRLKLTITADQIAGTIDRIAQGSSGSTEKLKARLGQGGVQFKTLMRQVEAQLAWNGVVRQRFSRHVKIDDKDVDRSFEQAKDNPPGKTQRFYSIQQVVLPYDKGASRELIYSRMVEAQRLQQNFKGCASIKTAAQGIFDIRIRNIGEVPQEAIPEKLRQIMNKTGPGNLTPPNVTPTGIELIAYCSNKVIKPEPLTRDAVEGRLLEQQYSLHAQRYLRDLRRDSLVEYRE